jgi:hypothetical protein
MSCDALAAYLAARGFAADRDNNVVIHDGDLERFHDVLDAARLELPASAWFGAMIREVEPITTTPRHPCLGRILR